MKTTRPILPPVQARGKTRVVVGLSGGVDSSLAAALLLEQGFEPIGVTVRLGSRPCAAGDSAGGAGATPAGLHDARAVCDALGIPHHLVEAEDRRARLIEYFVNEYKAGRTPNPCVVCNATVKFATLLAAADRLDAEFVATGHYARIERPATGRPQLRRGRDPRKDQSYFLFAMRPAQLRRCLMPLGDLTKADTRARARQRGLVTSENPESMEICFVPGQDYVRFLEENRLVTKHRGEIVDREGRVLGYHDGIEFFTIGQRQGLRIATGKPIYVVELDPASNRVVVGDNAALDRHEFRIERCNWLAFDAPPDALEATARIRYNHPGCAANVFPMPDGSALVRLETPQRAVTPGQACVLYDGDWVLGGGWIAR